MKKILLSAIALTMGMASVSAQTTPYIFTKVADNTYAVTMTQEEIAAAFDAQWVADAWSIGVAFPANTVIYEDENVTITSAVEKTPIYTANGKITNIKTDFPTYTGYMNAGSTLAQNNWKGDEVIQDIADVKANNQGIISVTPKKNGVLGFGAYAGDNSRSIGIYKLATESEKENDNFGSWAASDSNVADSLAYVNFRNDGENGTTKNAPAYIGANVEKGRTYALIAGGNKNLCVHQITFVPAAEEPATPYIFTKVADGTYAITMTQEEIAAAFDAQWVADAWSIGVAFPANTVIYEDDDVTITSAVEKTPIYTANGKITNIKTDFPTYTGYMNAGSTLAQNNWKGDEVIQDIADVKANNQGIISVTPKKNGVLGFGAYAGDNSRSIGIYKLATESEKENDNFGSWAASDSNVADSLAYVNFRNDGENGTTKNAPAYIGANVEKGRTYALIAGGNKNLCVHQITFKTGTDGIKSINNNATAISEKTVKAIYTVDGALVSSLKRGINIVKFTDGTSIKVVR